jgi:cytochrome c oxidase subunit 2
LIRLLVVVSIALAGCKKEEAPKAADPNVASAEAGKQLHVNRGCSACHSTDGSKLVGPTFKGLWGRRVETASGVVVADLSYFKESILNPNAKVANGFQPTMPPQKLSEVEIESLYLYVQTLQ